MATQYQPRPYTNPQRWLLTDGSTLLAPQLEESPTGRNVRIAGTTASESVHSNEERALVRRWIKDEVYRRNASIWTCVGKEKAPYTDGNLSELEMGLHSQTGNAEQVADLHLFKDNGKSFTTCYWRYEHPTLPFVGQIIVRLHERGQRYYGEASPARVVVSLMYLNTEAGDFSSEPSFLQVDDPDEWPRDHGKPDWVDAIPFGTSSHPNDRAAAKAMLEAVRAIDGLATVSVPDGREPDKWMTLEFKESNVHGGFLAEVQDYVDTEQDVERLQELWTEMRAIFRKVGLTLEEHDIKNFELALNGKVRALESAIDPVADADGVDKNHKVHIDLPNGIIAVTCSVKHSEDSVQEWEIAKVRAEMTGELDELLAYVRAHAEREDQDRIKSLLKSARGA